MHDAPAEPAGAFPVSGLVLGVGEVAIVFTMPTVESEGPSAGMLIGSRHVGGVSTNVDVVRVNGPAALAAAELMHLPVVGPGSPQIRVQGRFVFDEDVNDLVSSIATIGVLEPILVERVGDDLFLIAGERRLRAAQRVVAEFPEVETLTRGIPAMVVDGPVPESELRVWQVIENFAREDLSPTELGRAMMMTRCALLLERLEGAGLVVPDEIVGDADPVSQFRRLDEFRVASGAHSVGAPMDDVVDILGIEISASRAQTLLRAYTTIPADIAPEMDEAKITVRTRLGWMSLAKRNEQLARDIWERVLGDDSDDPNLLGRAVNAAKDNPGLDADSAVAAAKESADKPAVDTEDRKPARKQAKEKGLLDDLVVQVERVSKALRGGVTLGEEDSEMLRGHLNGLFDLLGD